MAIRIGIAPEDTLWHPYLWLYRSHLSISGSAQSSTSLSSCLSGNAISTQKDELPENKYGMWRDVDVAWHAKTIEAWSHWSSKDGHWRMGMAVNWIMARFVCFTTRSRASNFAHANLSRGKCSKWRFILPILRSKFEDLQSELNVCSSLRSFFSGRLDTLFYRICCVEAKGTGKSSIQVPPSPCGLAREDSEIRLRGGGTRWQSILQTLYGTYFDSGTMSRYWTVLSSILHLLADYMMVISGKRKDKGAKKSRLFTNGRVSVTSGVKTGALRTVPAWSLAYSRNKIFHPYYMHDLTTISLERYTQDTGGGQTISSRRFFSERYVSSCYYKILPSMKSQVGIRSSEAKQPKTWNDST